MCGINHERWQKRLLSEPDLRFKKAYDIAVGSESADRNYKLIRQKVQPRNLPRPALPTEGDREPTRHASIRGRESINHTRVYSSFHSKGNHKSPDSQSETSGPARFYSCYRCNGNNKALECPYLDAIIISVESKVIFRGPVELASLSQLILVVVIASISQINSSRTSTQNLHSSQECKTQLLDLVSTVPPSMCHLPT